MDILDQRIMKALGNSTRKEIIKLLAKRPHTASEISRALGRHVTTVSEHLDVLGNSGLVSRSPSGKWVYYSLTPKAQNFFRPNYSWTIIFAISALSMAAGIYSHLYRSSYAAAGKAAENIQGAAETAPSAAAEFPLGLLLIAIGALGLGYLAVKHLRAKTLRKESIYIKQG